MLVVFLHPNLVSFLLQGLQLLKEHALLVLHFLAHTRQLVVKNVGLIARGDFVDVVKFLRANFLNRSVAIDWLLLSNGS